MENLAVELLDQVFTLACTDGGYTGCSLSLVSQYIRNTSRASRFHSISLVSGSARQLAQFSACFAAERAVPGGTTPKIRHLCIASVQREVEVKSRPKAEADWEQQAFSRDVSSLFHIVARDLYTLSLIQGDRPWPKELHLPNVTGLSFPALEELTMVGSGMKYAPADEMLDGGCVDPQLPRLTRVHLTFTFSGLRTGLDFERWSARAPHITHFRISNLDYYSSSILTKLKAFIESDKVACPFRDLQQVLMQPCGPPTPKTECAHLYIVHGNYISSLRQMRQNAKRPFELVQPTELLKTEGGFVVVARREFLDRLNGGPGCWNISAEDLPEFEDSPSPMVVR